MTNRLKVFIFNDTRYDYHFGCILTVNALFDCLSNRGILISGTSRSGNIWTSDENVIKNLHNSDIVIVNGEGTFHHNQKAAHRLADVATYCKKIDKPCYLINSVYCRNDLHLAKKMEDFDRIYVRDSKSKIELKSCGINSKVVPDLIFKYIFNRASNKNDGILVTDAVSHPRNTH